LLPCSNCSFFCCGNCGWSFIKISQQQIKLEKNEQNHQLRIKELEKKNGHEQHQIDELKKEIQELKRKLESRS